jgi:hypothetical protein
MATIVTNAVYSTFCHFLWTLILFSQTVFAGQRHGDPSIIQESDPNSRYMCKGQLGDFAACTCMEAASEISCINAQFVDADVFLHINGFYKSINKITFHGNNFQDLPNRPLFGDVEHRNLHVLNISANYIVNLNSNALQGMPNIRVLDLSNNEIVLRPQDVNFLSHTPLITHLYFRRAFTSTVNRTKQFDLMMQLFSNGKLNNLQFLDLSYNYLTSVPYSLACPFPSLNTLDLRQNMMRTITMNTTCLSGMNTIDLSQNSFHEMDQNFRENFANLLPNDMLIMRNSFHCDCHSSPYIQWIRSTGAIRGKNLLTCGKASPEKYRGARLVEVPLLQLDCSVSLNSANPLNRFPVTSIFALIFATKLLLFL